MNDPDAPILVLGLGNLLLGDDGVGIHVVHELRDRSARGATGLPGGAAIVDGGTLGLGLLPLISRAHAVVIVDALDSGAAPGTVTVLDAEALLAGCAGNGSTLLGDRAGLADLLTLARLLDTLPAAIALVGVQPAEIAVGLDLGAAVRQALPSAIEALVATAHRLVAQANGSDSALLARALESVGVTA